MRFWPCFFRHVEAEEKPSKKSKKGGAKGTVALLKESTQLGCVSQDSYPRKSILHDEGKWGSKHVVKFSKCTWHQKKSGKKGSIAGHYPKNVNLMGIVLARQNSGKDHMRRPCTKKDALVEWHGIWRKYYKLKNAENTTVYFPIEARVMPLPTSKSPQEREFVVDS